MSFGEFLLILRARRVVALAVFVGVVALAVTASLLMTRKYIAVASVVVENRPDPVATATYAEEQSAYLATQVGIITSDRVVRRVVQALKLDQAPGVRERWLQATHGRGELMTWVGDGLKTKLSVAPAGESNVVNIAVKWSDGRGAAELANAFAQAYIDTSVELRVEPAKRYAGWFDERARALRADLEAKQKLLSDYQNEKALIAPDEHLDIESARLGELSSQLVTIQAQLQDSQSRERQVGGNIDAVPEILQSPVIQSLKASLSQAESKQKDIATRLGTSHPEYISTQSEITSLRERIAHESATIIASLSNTTQVNQRREREVSAALAAQKKRVLELKQLRDQAADLQNDVATAQRNLDAVNQRLAQSSLEGETQQANVVLLAPATEPLEYSSPNLMINTVVGVFFGLVMGIGTALLLELRDRRVRGDAELAQLLGVPIMGRISAIAPRAAAALPWQRALPRSQSQAP
jgi:chain length determinant protein EpsF